MDISEHVSATDLTAMYPEAGTGSLLALAYVALGLAGETSELLEQVTAGNASALAAEAGDVLWYCSRLHRECAIDPAATFGALEPVAGDPMVTVAVAAGRLAELVKKAIRDDGTLTDGRRVLLTDGLRRLASAWTALVSANGLDPGAVARANVDKLLSRQQRNTLTGSGDDR